MRTLLFVAGCLLATPSFGFVAWTCTYNGETYSVGMPCEEAIKLGITPPLKELLERPECTGLKQQRDAALAQLETAVSAPGNVPDEEIARLDRNFRDLGAMQHRFGCRDAPPLP
ncbi:hypothetical protein N5J06_20015 [Ralstonia sp. CHL-2022]|uniref:DUF4124 domain-containing protein n=1 Tax=Ralstonia mojiangensis TaxID=2953895 RepID=A0ABT2LDK8_9RALS|nr:hypothetical protein [Ralstonia mojiangensis]MCT7313266.1 hypothetical protein [Ralstonia mojiangensis]